MPLLALLAVLGVLLLTFGGRVGEEGEPDLEGEVAELCSTVAGVGECRVMLTVSEGGEVQSVAVVCDGGDSARVRAALTDLLSDLFGIGASRITVHKMAKEGISRAPLTYSLTVT